jgi:hypothetical protein
MNDEDQSRELNAREVQQKSQGRQRSEERQHESTREGSRVRK